MYPTLPVESVSGAAQLLCYFFTVVAALVTVLISRH